MGKALRLDASGVMKAERVAESERRKLVADEVRRSEFQFLLPDRSFSCLSRDLLSCFQVLVFSHREFIN